MKRTITIVSALVIILSMALFLTGCNKVDLENSWEPPDYKTLGQVEQGMDALDLLLEAIENMEDADYIFVSSLDFTAKVAVVLATQQNIEIKKFSGNEVFFQETKQGTGLGKSNEGIRFYYNGTSGYEVKEDSETRFPELGTEEWSGMQYQAYEDYEKRISDLRSFSSYTLVSGNLADSHDSKVYSYNGKYYLSITVNCMDVETGTVHKKVEDEIENATDAEPGSFRWKEDTVMFFEITEIAGNYYVTARRVIEQYSGKQAGIATASVYQVISGTYSYAATDYAITNQEKLNLA